MSMYVYIRISSTLPRAYTNFHRVLYRCDHRDRRLPSGLPLHPAVPRLFEYPPYLPIKILFKSDSRRSRRCDRNDARKIRRVREFNEKIRVHARAPTPRAKGGGGEHTPSPFPTSRTSRALYTLGCALTRTDHGVKSSRRTTFNSPASTLAPLTRYRPHPLRSAISKSPWLRAVAFGADGTVSATSPLCLCVRVCLRSPVRKGG